MKMITNDNKVSNDKNTIKTTVKMKQRRKLENHDIVIKRRLEIPFKKLLGKYKREQNWQQCNKRQILQ